VGKGRAFPVVPLTWAKPWEELAKKGNFTQSGESKKPKEKRGVLGEQTPTRRCLKIQKRKDGYRMSAFSKGGSKTVVDL